MYIDESGDVGHNNSPSRYFVLSAIVVHETSWQNIMDDLITFRRSLKSVYGLLMREEIHASEFVNGRPKLKNGIPRPLRLSLLKQCLLWLASRSDVSIYSVCCDKNANPNKDIFEFAWRTLIQRFDNTLAYKNFPGPWTGNDKGIILSDDTNGGKLTHLLREMRRYNPVPNLQSTYGVGYNNILLRAIIEDPIFRDSKNSYLHQMVDVVTYFARQFFETNKFVKKKGAKKYYGLLGPVINKHVTKYRTPFSIVCL